MKVSVGWAGVVMLANFSMLLAALVGAFIARSSR
jgi:hypothetical protein